MGIVRTKIIESNNSEDIFYSIKNGELTFYYKNTLIFSHSKFSPFLSIIREKNWIKKEIPSKDYKFISEKKNNYLIDFICEEYRCKISLFTVDNRLIIDVISEPNIQKIKLVFSKNNANRILGFCPDSLVNYNKQTVYYSEETPLIPAFYVKNNYLMALHECGNWQVDIKNQIVITAESNRFYIEVFSGKNLEEISQNYCYRKYKNTRVNADGIILRGALNNINADIIRLNKNNLRVSKVIIDEENSEQKRLLKIVGLLKENNIDCLVKISPKVDINTNRTKLFSAEDFLINYKNDIICENKKYIYLNIFREETAKKIKNELRTYLDLNILGLYSELKPCDINKFNSLYNNYEYQYQWQKIIMEVKKEYFNDFFIFDTLTTLTYKVGYCVKKIKNTKEMSKFDIKSYRIFLSNQVVIETEKISNKEVGSLQKYLNEDISHIIVKF